MKNYLLSLLLIISIATQAQTYQNPTFGKLTLKTNTLSTSTARINTQDTITGQVNYINALSLPVPTSVINAIKQKAYLSTGLIKNGLISANGDPTKFNITAGIGIISNFDDPENPVSTIINFPAFNSITPTYLTTGNITYVAINSTPSVVMQATPFTPEQRRSLIVLGATIHSNLTTINVLNNISAPTNADTNQLHDFMEAVGALNITGNKYTANGANLQLNKSAGVLFKLGSNFAVDWKNPHEIAQTGGTSITFRYRTQNGTESADMTSISPNIYDLNNVLTTVPNNKFTIQTVTVFQTGLTRIQWGQTLYDDLQSAKNALLTRDFAVENNIKENGVTRAYIIVRNSTTSLQNVSDAYISEAQKFGGVASGGVALTLANIVTALGFTPANDTDAVHKTGTETITGVKTFSSDLSLGGNIIGNGSTILKTFWGGAYGGAVQIKTDAFTTDRYSRIGMVNSEGIYYGGMTIDNDTNATFSNSVTAASFVKSGGTSSQFLKADGSSDISVYATLASPALTGTPTAPTASPGTNTTQIATTAFVNGAIGNGTALSANSITLLSTSTNTDFPIPFVSSGSSFQNIYNNAPITINPSTNLVKLGGSMQITGATTATSFINSTATATNALLANGTTLANPISGTGTTGYLPKFTSAGVLGNSQVFDNGTNIGIGTTSTTEKLTIDGAIRLGNMKLDHLGLGRIGFNRNTSTGEIYDSTKPAFQIQHGDSRLEFQSYASSGVGGAKMYFSDTKMEIESVNGVTATSFVTAGGTSSQYVKGDGSLSSTAPDSRPYKVYTALISQSGTSAPTVTVLENTLGGNPTLNYTGVGNYGADLTGAFTPEKTAVIISNGTPLVLSAYRLSNDRVLINCGAGNDRITNATIEIRVYN